MVTSEIGSEFHYSSLGYKRYKKNRMLELNDSTYTFSGRTALEVILKNLSGIGKVLLPSYCCESMIEPFCTSNIEVDFYDVNWDNGFRENIKIDNDVDVILWCNYFGFQRTMPNIEFFKAHGGIVIEDITHSFLSREPFHIQSEYVIASVRKWFPVLCGGYCASRSDKMYYKPTQEVPRQYIDTKILAMKQKAEFLSCGSTELKNQYMQNFLWCNHWLTENYSGLKIDSESMEYLDTVDFDKIRKKRIENASVIYEYLDAQKHVYSLFSKQDMDCPLFVPILFENKKERDAMRKKLTEEKIYCPVHWPKPNYQCQSNLYDIELSLICDQRYNIDDMKRMMKIICN